MPRATTTDISLTKFYIPKVSKIPGISPTIAKFYKSIENRNIHEGRVADQAITNPTTSSVSSQTFASILSSIRSNPQIPYNGNRFYKHKDLASLEYSQETEGPYCTELPTPDDSRRLLELERVVARHSVSSSSSHHQGTPSRQYDDDDDDVENSRASTPSPTTYLNSLNPLNYQNYHMPSASEQIDETLFERQTTLLNQTQKYIRRCAEGSSHLERVL
ncbi:hypothetical protein Tco_1514815 [Tanacetum coccineum]